MTDDNKALVGGMLARFAAGDLDGATSYLHEDFVSHNPRVPHDPSATSGKKAFIDFFGSPAGQRLLAARTAVQRVLADADLVAVHSRIVNADGTELAAVDILRISDGQVIEHWDVVEPVPANPANPHGMF